jgi:methylase of polypeptide subunit release factors
VSSYSLRAPTIDRARLAALAQHLTAIGFTEDGIRAAGGGGATNDPWSFTSGDVSTDGSPLSVVTRLFCYGVVVERRLADAAFGPLKAADLQDLGLVELEGDRVRPLSLIRPYQDLWVTSDLPGSQTEIVLGAVPAAETLARLTIRTPAAKALDLGTGCGLQAMLLARHASSVTAIDINPHATALASFNAALNGLGNIDVREGSWFGPVDHERFDIIACNPPYVISPDNHFVYRDGGLTRDHVSQMVIGESAAHLAEGGFATVLINWIHTGDWAAALWPWLAGNGCDALILHYASVDPVSYASRWNMELRAKDPAAYETTVRRWVDYFRRERIEKIAFGGVVLRKRGAASNWVRALAMSEGPTGSCSDQILRLFDAADFLESPRAEELYAHAYSLIDQHRIDQVLGYSDGKYAVAPAVFRKAPGLGLDAPIDARALEVVLECTPARTLGELVEATAAARGEPVGDVKALVGDTVRQLVEKGFMVPVVKGS